MRRFLTKSLAAVALTSLSVTASATLLDPLEYKSGGVTWLQLSETAGLSWNDFAAGVGGWNKNYDYALNSQIDTLLSSFGLGIGDTGYVRHNDGISAFVFSMGGATSSGAAGTYFFDGNQGALGRGLGRYVSAELTNGDAGSALGPDCPAYNSCSRFYAVASPQTVRYGSPTVGLFLVRKEAYVPPPAKVPEPSSLALIGIGAAFAFRRKKR